MCPFEYCPEWHEWGVAIWREWAEVKVHILKHIAEEYEKRKAGAASEGNA